MNPEDEKHLNLLALFHYIVGGITALFACMPFLHVIMGIAMMTGNFFKTAEGSAPPPPLMGWMFVIMGSVFILFGWAMAIAIMVAGRKLKHRRNRLFCMVVAGFECMFMPFGTVLGVFTLIVLSRETVRDAFETPHT